MSKKKKNREKESTIENYYDLKVDKIDELVAALKSDGGGTDGENEQPQTEQPLTMNIAEITGEEEKKRGGKKSKEFDPYKRGKLSFLPVWLKAIFIKWWFAGAVCFFIMWGIGLQGVDALLLVGVVMGVIVDVLVNPIFRMLESDKKEYNPYIMFPFPLKAFWTFFTNILYYTAICFIVNYGYLSVNLLANLSHGTEGLYYVGVEPLLFGVFCVIVDMAFIGVKDLVVFLVKRGKKDKEKEITDV